MVKSCLVLVNGQHTVLFNHLTRCLHRPMRRRISQIREERLLLLLSRPFLQELNQLISEGIRRIEILSQVLLPVNGLIIVHPEVVRGEEERVRGVVVSELRFPVEVVPAARQEAKALLEASGVRGYIRC